jgi:hypothetical protein
VSRLAGGRARRGPGLDAGEERRILVRAWVLVCLMWMVGLRVRGRSGLSGCSGCVVPGDMMIDGCLAETGCGRSYFRRPSSRGAGGQCLRRSWPHAHQRSAGRLRARQPRRCRWSGTVRSARGRCRRVPAAGGGSGGPACAPPTWRPGVCLAAGRPARSRRDPVTWRGRRSGRFRTVPSAAMVAIAGSGARGSVCHRRSTPRCPGRCAAPRCGSWRSGVGDGKMPFIG